MLAVIGYKVHQRKAVVGCDEVHAGLNAAPLRCIEVWRAKYALFHIGKHTFVALDKTAYAIAELSVPFCPASPRRERAYLVESARIPSFRYEFGLAEHGVVSQRFE